MRVIGHRLMGALSLVLTTTDSEWVSAAFVVCGGGREGRAASCALGARVWVAGRCLLLGAQPPLSQGIPDPSAPETTARDMLRYPGMPVPLILIIRACGFFAMLMPTSLKQFANFMILRAVAIVLVGPPYCLG